jgi:glycosyltransferase involved in cell wall biosynthesis
VTAGGPGPADLSGLAITYLAGRTTGGTGRHVVMLASGCAARGAAVSVYGPAILGYRAEPGRAGQRAPGPAPARPGAAWQFRELEIGDHPRPARDTAAARQLRALLAQTRPDVLHAHGLRAGAVAALALAGPPRRATALVVTVHNAPPPGRAAAALYAGLELIVARRAEAVLTVSGDLAARLRRRGARDAGRALVPAPPAAPATGDDVLALRRGLGAAARPVVFAAGRLTAQKDFATLLSAAAGWQRREPVPLLVIAGAGPQEAALRRQAAAGGVAAAFLGQRGDVPVLLAAADVVAVPSRWEGQPLIVQEALRAGRPLVAARVGGIAELTGADGAVLIPAGDPAALATAVTRLLDNPQAAADQAAAARSAAARLPTGDAAVDQVARLYRRLARRGNAPPISDRP